MHSSEECVFVETLQFLFEKAVYLVRSIARHLSYINSSFAFLHFSSKRTYLFSIMLDSDTLIAMDRLQVGSQLSPISHVVRLQYCSLFQNDWTLGKITLMLVPIISASRDH